MSEIKPLNNNVIFFQKEEAEKETSFGLIISKTDDTKICTVLAVGPKCFDVKVGEEILVDWKKATPIIVDGKQMASIKEDDILAVA